MKKFKYRNYENCYFIVSSYQADEQAMYIGIESETVGSIADCTVFVGYAMYNYGIVTIKNYTENSNLTNFLKELGIIEEVCKRYPCNDYPDTINSLNSNNPQTIDFCKINIEQLKKYSKEWHYNYEK